jgi:hypothetical protein
MMCAILKTDRLVIPNNNGHRLYQPVLHRPHGNKGTFRATKTLLM